MKENQKLRCGGVVQMTVCTLLRMEKQCILILISTDSFNFFQLLSKKYKHDSAKATSLQLQATKNIYNQNMDL